jgi:tetratricopeptide (TPR) repeat protein
MATIYHSKNQFFPNPEFMDYVRLLYDLHVAIKDGWDETAEGEALRDRMDSPGSRLSGEEITSLQGISADFYSVAEEPAREVLPITPEVMADLEAALKARRWKDLNQALELLRKQASHVPPAALAYLRGMVWMEAGEYPIATTFLQRASELEPDNTNYRCLALRSLSKADPAAASEHAQTILSNSEKHAPTLVLEAANILAQQARRRPSDQTRQELQSLIPIVQDSIFRLETSGETGIHPGLLGEAFGLIDAFQKQIG